MQDFEQQVADTAQTTENRSFGADIDETGVHVDWQSCCKSVR